MDKPDKGMPMKRIQADDKVALGEAAPLLGVSPFTLRAWIRQKRLPFFRVGRRIVFSRHDLAEFLDGCRVQPKG